MRILTDYTNAVRLLVIAMQKCKLGEESIVSGYSQDHVTFKGVLNVAWMECEFEHAPEFMWELTNSHYAFWYVNSDNETSLYFVKTLHQNERGELLDIYGFGIELMPIRNIIKRMAIASGIFVAKVRCGALGNQYAAYESYCGLPLIRGTKAEIKKLCDENNITKVTYFNGEW